MAEVAVLEEEIRRLEEMVLHCRKDLDQEEVNMSSSKMKMEHSLENSKLGNAAIRSTTTLSGE